MLHYNHFYSPVIIHGTVDQKGTVCLFYGASGVGKFEAAQCLGYELGKPLKEINGAEIIARLAYPMSKNNIESIFTEAKE